MVPGLPQAEGGGGVVLDHGHAAFLHHIRGFHQDCPPGGANLGENVINTFDRHVAAPMGRNPLLLHAAVHLPQAGDVLAALLQNGVGNAGVGGTVFKVPAHQLAVELLGGGGVGGRQVHPAEGPGVILGIFRHRLTSFQKIRIAQFLGSRNSRSLEPDEMVSG